MRSLPSSHDTPASTRNEDVEDNSALAAAAIPARPTVRWSDRRRSRMRPRGRHRCRRARMDRWSARAWIAPVRVAAYLRSGLGWTRRAGDGHERVGGPIGTAGGLPDRRTRVRRAYVIVPAAFSSRSPPAERASYASAASGTSSSAEPAGQATMWSTLVRHGQASQGEPNPELSGGLRLAALGATRAQRLWGSKPQEGVAVTATTMD